MRWLVITLVIIFVLSNATSLGMLVDPWAPWRMSGHAGESVTLDPSTSTALPITVPAEPGDLLPHHTVTDADRYRLALDAGFSPAEAIIATAISIAENGRGDPALPSAPNKDHSIDLGLWQINSSHWAEFGGAQALIVPINNARAARVLYLRGGWNQWCTYPGGCGGLPGASNWPQALERARAASQVPLLPGQA